MKHLTMNQVAKASLKANKKNRIAFVPKVVLQVVTDTSAFAHAA